MFSMDLDVTQEERDVLIADLWEMGGAGFVELEASVRVFFESTGGDELRDQLRARFPGARFAEAENHDWIAEARSKLPSRNVGQRFFLAPEWCDDPEPGGRIRISVNNGMAFGTGAHESTRLCLELLEETIQPGDAVADVGTGSGILAEAALLLGAACAIACDIDPDSVEIAAERLRDYSSAKTFTGSVDQIETESVDLLLANISPQCLISLAGHFARVLRPTGRAILGGIEDQDVAAVVTALAAVGFIVKTMQAEAEWRAVHVVKQFVTQ